MQQDEAIYFMYITGYNSYSMYNDTISKKNYFINELNKRRLIYLNLESHYFSGILSISPFLGNNTK